MLHHIVYIITRLIKQSSRGAVGFCQIFPVSVTLINLIFVLQAVSSFPCAASPKRPSKEVGDNAFWSSVSSTEITENKEHSIILGSDPRPFILATGSSTVVYDFSKVIEFSANHDDKYSFQYQTDDKIIGIAVYDDKKSILNNPTTFLNPIQIGKIQLILKKGQKVWIVLGARSASAKTIIRVGIFSAESAGLGSNKDREYSEIRVGKTIYNALPVAGGNIPTRFFRIDRRSAKNWMQISASSLSTQPYIVVLDKNDGFVRDTERKQTVTKSTITIGPNVEWSSFAVLQLTEINADGSGKINNTVESEKINVEIDEYSYNPSNSMFSQLSEYLGNPIVSIPLGLVISVAISFYFYRKSVVLKRLAYYFEAYSLVRQPDKTKSPLLFGPNNEPIFCASVCTLTIVRKGFGHITQNDVLQALRLRLENVTKIITFYAEMTPESWLQPNLSPESPNTIYLNFSNLASRDTIEIMLVCEQNETGAIIPHVDGRLKDVKISRIRAQLRDYLFPVVMAAVTTIYMVTGALAVGSIDNYFELDSRSRPYVIAAVFAIFILMGYLSVGWVFALSNYLGKFSKKEKEKMVRI